MQLSEAIQRRIMDIAHTIEDQEIKAKVMKVFLAAYDVREYFLESMVNFSDFAEIFKISIVVDSLIYEININYNPFAICLLTRNVEFSADEDRKKSAGRYYQKVIEQSVTHHDKNTLSLLSNLRKVFISDRENYPKQYWSKDYLLRKCQLCQLLIEEKPKSCLEALCEWLSKDTHYIRVVEQDDFLKNLIRPLIEDFGAQITSTHSQTLNYIKTIVDPLLAVTMNPIQ